MKKPGDEQNSEADDLSEYTETDLPEGVTFEDALRGLTEVDPEAVKEAEEVEKKRKRRSEK